MVSTTKRSKLADTRIFFIITKFFDPGIQGPRIDTVSGLKTIPRLGLAQSRPFPAQIEDKVYDLEAVKRLFKVTLSCGTSQYRA